MTILRYPLVGEPKKALSERWQSRFASRRHDIIHIVRLKTIRLRFLETNTLERVLKYEQPFDFYIGARDKIAPCSTHI